MSSKFIGANKLAANKVATWLAAGAVVAMAGAFATPASADTKVKRYDERGRPYYGPSGPNAVYQQGRTRIYVSKRSWLDGGTEVNPGDRKFTDYAFPPAVGYPTFARENLNRPIDRQPLSTPADLGGYPQNFPLY
ncbi:hypothetical protein JQ543_29820 [Bradyrhizobium diazoefficiens]|nr:hypothetical protein [Bradyrhizobium diazoefficiens]MBR0851971.1 hypothetical protein [Bradyrhizobium diazoefficiens]